MKGREHEREGEHDNVRKREHETGYERVRQKVQSQERQRPQEGRYEREETTREQPLRSGERQHEYVYERVSIRTTQPRERERTQDAESSGVRTGTGSSRDREHDRAYREQEKNGTQREQEYENERARRRREVADERGGGSTQRMESGDKTRGRVQGGYSTTATGRSRQRGCCSRPCEPGYAREIEEGYQKREPVYDSEMIERRERRDRAGRERERERIVCVKEKSASCV